MPFEDSDLTRALMNDKVGWTDITEVITSAYGQLRDHNGRTFIHQASCAPIKPGSPEAEVNAWTSLLTKCDMFIRDVDGVSGLDAMIGKVDTGLISKIISSFIKQTSAKDSLLDLIDRAVMSGKLGYLKQFISSQSPDQSVKEHIQKVQSLEDELREIHEGIRTKQDTRQIMAKLSKPQLAEISDLSGLPALHLAVVHENSEIVEELIKRFPNAINQSDNMGRTAMHYAVSIKTPAGESMVKMLSDANIDLTIKDIQGKDVEQMKTEPIDMGSYQLKYAEILERNTSQYLMYKVHDAVVSGDTRQVKMALERKEQALQLDRSQLTALHKAVILGHKDIVEWIVQNYPKACDVQGTRGLTPMHLAAVVDNAMYEIMDKSGGDKVIIDAEGSSPEHYRQTPSDMPIDLINLRQCLVGHPPSRPVSVVSKKPQSAKPESSTKQAPPIIQSKVKKTPVALQSLDARYIAEALGTPLTAALSDVIEKRPWDPIEFLAQWLHKHKNNLNYLQKTKEATINAEQEEKLRVLEQENKIKRKKEVAALKKKEEDELKLAEDQAKKQKETEELQKKAKESLHLAQPPELATVAEVSEEPESSTTAAKIEKDENGQTAFHHLVSTWNDDSQSVLNALLLKSGGNIGECDKDGKTARDLAVQEEKLTLVSALDKYVHELFQNEEFSTINLLSEDGYLSSELLAQIKEENLSEAANELVETNSGCREKFDLIQKAVKEGNVRQLKQLIDRKAYASYKNTLGFTILHLAILSNQQEATEYIVTAIANSVHAKDTMNRTPLHYAIALEKENLAAILTNAGASTDAVDCKLRKPADLPKEEIQGLIQSMEEADSSTEPAEVKEE